MRSHTSTIPKLFKKNSMDIQFPRNNTLHEEPALRQSQQINATLLKDKIREHPNIFRTNNVSTIRINLFLIQEILQEWLPHDATHTIWITSYKRLFLSSRKSMILFTKDFSKDRVKVLKRNRLFKLYFF